MIRLYYGRDRNASRIFLMKYGSFGCISISRDLDAKTAAVKFTAAVVYFYFDSARAFSKVFLMLSDGALSMRLTTMIAMTEKKKPGTSS